MPTLPASAKSNQSATDFPFAACTTGEPPSRCWPVGRKLAGIGSSVIAMALSCSSGTGITTGTSA
jgi:hypothetical protein